MFNKDDFKALNYNDLHGKTLKMIVVNNIDGFLLAGQDIETNKIYMLDLKPNREEKPNTITDWRVECIRNIEHRIEKCYKEFEIDELLKIKDELEDIYGKDLGYTLFESVIVGMKFKKSIMEAKNRGDK